MPLNYNYIDIPVKTQAGIPNPDNYSSEAMWYQYLQFIVATDGKKRSDTGSCVFKSPSSGVTYNTNDVAWRAMPNIYNRGQEGMMNLLHYLYASPTNGKGWIVSSSGINNLALQVDKIEDGRITVKNSLNLNGHPDSYFVAKTVFDSTVSQIKNGTIIVGNADKLDGFNSTYFATQTFANTINTNVNNIINGTTKVPKASVADTATSATNANNANTLGGNASSYFLPASSAVKAYGGTGAPSASLGKDGDVYVLYT